MTLQEFLLTADAEHSVALQQARNYQETQGRFITSNSLTVYVVQLGLYSVFHDVANTVGHQARDICMAVMDRLRGVSDFNFIANTPMGDANHQLLDSLIALLPDHSTALNQLKTLVTGYCNQPSIPFANVTLHDVLIASDACPTKPVSAQGGFVTITTTAACEKHNPRLMALNPRTNKWQRVNSFYGVDAAGVYDAAVPAQFSGWQLLVDDPYEVM